MNGNGWYISNQCNVWNVVNIDSTDAFSINFSEKINCKLFINDYGIMSYHHLKSFIENKCNIERDTDYFNKYILE